MSEKKVYKICITGGPCSGKTTSMAKIVETFASEFTVYTLPEVATMTFSSGVTIIPTEFSNESHRVFTTGICQMQIDLETYFEKISENQKKKVLIMCDRGVCDNFAFCSEENKELIMQETGWTKNFLLNERYDMVVHLVTTAIGAEEFYTLENNSARSESREQSAILDRRLIKEYQGHPNFVIIDNRPGGFPKKIDRMLNAITNLTGAKTPHKYIKKYLLGKNFSVKSFPGDLKIEKYTEEHNFLVTSKPNVMNWVFKRIYAENYSPIFIHVMRIIEDSFERRIETHKTISEKNYYNFIAQRDSNYAPLKKEMVSFLWMKDNKFSTYSIETMLIRNEEISILRVISDCEDDKGLLNIPEFLPVDQEITENPIYFSANLSRIL
jgi:nicotinamide riboside kinase